MPELGRGMVAHHVHAVPPFGQGQALGHQSLKLGGFHLGAVLLALEAALPLLVVIEIALDPGSRAVEEVDLAPEHFFEVGIAVRVLEPRLGDFNDDLRAYGLEALRQHLAEQIGLEDRKRLER